MRKAKIFISLLVFLFVLFTLFGGYNKQPKILGFHWRGSVLYNERGIEVASVVTFPSFIDSSQVCIYSTSGKEEEGCTYWETGQQAYNHVEEVFVGNIK